MPLRTACCGQGSLKASSPPISRPERVRRPPASDAGICCSRSTTALSSRLQTSRQLLRGAEAGQTARYTILRLGTREVVDLRIAPIPNGPRALYFLLAGSRHLHAAGRRRRAPAPSARSRDAPFLLAVRSRSSASSRFRSAAGSIVSTGSSTGATRSRCSRCRRCSSTSRWCSRSARGDGRRAASAASSFRWSTCRPWLLGIAHVVRRSRSSGGDCAAFVAGARNARSARVPVPRRLSSLRAWSRSRARSSEVRSITGAPAAAMDRVGHGARRQRRSRSAMRCRLRSASTRRCRCSCRRFRSA